MLLKKHFSILFASIFYISFVFGQEIQKGSSNNNISIGSLIKENNGCLIASLYGKSLSSGKKLVELQPDNANFNYRYGIALSNTSNSLVEPLLYLRKAISKTATEIDISNPNEKKAPNDAIFYYALALHRVLELDSAIHFYQLYLTKINEKSNFFNSANLFLQQANNAKNGKQNTELKSITLLSDSINSEFSDFAPVISFDGGNMFFSSGRNWGADESPNMKDADMGMFYEDIYSSQYSPTTQWNKPHRLAFCLPTENESSVSANIDERRIYTYDSKTGNGDIYYSDYFGGDFNKTNRLPNDDVNNANWQPHFFMGASGNVAFFSSENEPNGFGGLDIYMITRNKFGGWSAPINLGSEINSKYDEDAPFLTFDGRYLYFSSNGDKSYGGYDIFRAEYKDGKFIHVENLGFPINSTHDDLYFTITMDNKNALISSFRKDGHGSLDIYQLRFKDIKQDISVLKGRIYTIGNETKIPENIEIELACDNCENDIPVNLLPRIHDGRFVVHLKKCKKYTLKYINSNDKSIIKTQTFSTNCEAIYEEIIKELGVREFEDGKIIESYLYALTGAVYDKEINEMLTDVSVEMQTSSGVKVHLLTTDKNGYFITPDTASFMRDSSYQCKLILKKDGYITVSENVSFTAGAERQINIGKFGLEKTQKGKDLAKVIQIHPIYYDLDKSNIRKDAAVELDKIVTIMNLNPKMVIELGSHTDCRANNEYNLALSNRRAISAANYIKKRITNGQSRISGKGYGETMLLNNCACEGAETIDCTEEQHQLNRRTEFIIIKE